MTDLNNLNGGKPMLLSPWRLRNDSGYVVAYKCVTSEIKYRTLTAREASLVPFLNGELPLEDVRKLWNSVVFPFSNQGKPDFDEVYAGLSKLPGFIGEDGPISPSLLGDRTRLIPVLSSYEIPRERLLRPLNVNISFTERCRTDCIYCYAERSPNNPDIDFIKMCELLDQLESNEIFIVDVTGGDLFSRANVGDILQQMVKRDFVFYLSTKCYISRELADLMAELGIGRKDVLPHLQRTLQLSVDSADSQIASYLVRRPHFLEQMIDSVSNLVRAGISPLVKCVLSSFNSQTPRDLVKLFSNLGVVDFQFVQYGRSYYRHKDELFLSADTKKHLTREFQEIREEFPGLNIAYEDNPPVENNTWEEWHNRSICSGGRVSMLVKGNGDVTLCDQIPHIPGHVVGNVFKQGILGVWRSQALTDFLHPPQNRFEKTVCYNCPEFDNCHTGKGYCYRDSLFAYGSLYDSPPNCPAQKKAHRRTI
jgi:radical SAM protein with 4Fe4S-binding SPASM domain